MERSNVTITLYMSELIFDIQNKTYLTGRSRHNGTNHEEVANMQANDDDENLLQLQRSIQNAFSTLKTKLSEYLVSDQSAGDNEVQTNDEDLHLTLSMPTNYNHATVDTISAALHQYIVNIATSDWFTITNKNDATDYVTLASANLDLVRESMNKRVRPTRRNAGDNTSRYNIQTVATPVIVIGGTTAEGAVTFTINCATQDATIHYTTDGSTPNASSTVYRSAVTLTTSVAMVRAIAMRSGMYDSAVASKTFSA